MRVSVQIWAVLLFGPFLMDFGLFNLIEDTISHQILHPPRQRDRSAREVDLLGSQLCDQRLDVA